MSNGRDKHRSRLERAQVRSILLHHWDPIGVGDDPDAEDEYDAYGAEAYVLLIHQNASEDRLYRYLFGVASEYMELGDQERIRAVSRLTARKLIELRAELHSSEGQS